MSALRALKPLTAAELDQLQIFDAEVARGLVHRPGYAYQMAELRQRWEAYPPSAHGLPISEEIDRNYAKDLVEDAPKHMHNFDRLHGLCRCGESREEVNGHA